MKKILLSALAVFAFGAANAQEEGGFGFSKGDVIVEGNLSVSSNSVSSGNSTTTTTSYAFRPVGGYFITDKFAVGLGLNIASEKGSGSAETNTFGVTAAGRYYFLNLGQRFKVYGQAGLGFDSISTKPGDAKSTDIGFNAGLGVNYFLTKSIAINFGLTDVFSVKNHKVKDVDGSETKVNLSVNSFKNFFTEPTFGLTFKF